VALAGVRIQYIKQVSAASPYDIWLSSLAKKPPLAILWSLILELPDKMETQPQMISADPNLQGYFTKGLNFSEIVPI
jgi:hypothetical protein